MGLPFSGVNGLEAESDDRGGLGTDELEDKVGADKAGEADKGEREVDEVGGVFDSLADKDVGCASTSWRSGGSTGTVSSSTYISLSSST